MTVNLQFANLEPHVQDKFTAIASKDPSGASAVEWFEHLVPESLQDSSAETEVFMDGGSVTQDVWVHDQGTNSGHWDTVTHDIGDRDVSRINSGHNGGEYTHDNTIMEDSSINRGRGADDMSSSEFSQAEEANAFDAEFIDGGTAFSDTAEVGTEALVETGVDAADFFGVVGDVLSDIAAPAIGAYVVGTEVSKHMDNDQDKLGYGALAAGGAALLCATPIGATALTVYCGGKLFWKACNWLADEAAKADAQATT